MPYWLLRTVPCLLLFTMLVGRIVATEANADGIKSARSAQPWPKLKYGDFPAPDGTRRVEGTLVEADFIHRRGVLRRLDNGELLRFEMPPFGFVRRLNADADLRDVPLGIWLQFELAEDADNGALQLVSMSDEFSLMASRRQCYRVEQRIEADHRLLVRKQNLDSSKNDAGPIEELQINERTKIHNGNPSLSPNQVRPGELVLVDRSVGTSQNIGPCIEIWIGTDSINAATAAQRLRHAAFIRQRGVPAWVDHVDDDTMTVTLFASSAGAMASFLQDEHVDPAIWARERRTIPVVVANEHLRSYRATVLNRPARIVNSLPVKNLVGCGGIRWVLRPDTMLEGYRPGRLLRLFLHPNWPVNDMPFGEGLAAGGHDEEPADAKELQASEFPYRTDFGNHDLPWYQLQPGTFPPDYSEHRVSGELKKNGADGRSGQFRADDTDELVKFTLPDFGTVRYRNADANLKDVPLGTHCQFYLYQDAKRQFTIAAVVKDEFSDQISNTVTYRLESIDLEDKRLTVVRQAAPVKVDYVLEPRVPADLGRLQLLVGDRTKVRKDGGEIGLRDLAIGDDLLANRIGGAPKNEATCSEIWVGAAARKLASEKQQQKYTEFKRKNDQRQNR